MWPRWPARKDELTGKVRFDQSDRQRTWNSRGFSSQTLQGLFSAKRITHEVERGTGLGSDGGKGYCEEVGRRLDVHSGGYGNTTPRQRIRDQDPSEPRRCCQQAGFTVWFASATPRQSGMHGCAWNTIFARTTCQQPMENIQRTATSGFRGHDWPREPGQFIALLDTFSQDIPDPPGSHVPPAFGIAPKRV
jgi:hypothetical protein